MKTYRVMTADQAQELARNLVGLPLPFTVTVTEGEIRTNPQNDLLWKWNEEIARHRGDVSAIDVHRENKLLIGCPICMRNDAFRAFVSKLSHLTYSEKLEAMDFVPVTSRMTKKEMQEFMDGVERKFRAQGVPLTDPEMLRYEGQAA